ncbi:oxidoreductase [Caproiciproducens sp.]
MCKVLTPIQVGPMKLKNRVQFLAMAKGLCNPDNTVSDREIAYFETVAKGGTALITTGACIVFPEYPSVLPCQPGLYDDKFLPGLKKLADAVHKHGAKLLLQPWHPGEAAYGCDPAGVKKVADFSIDEIKAMQRRFAEAALRAREAGADGIEVHIAHNYLMEEFLTPLFNKRTDEYGAQNMENGLRFSTEMIRMIKEACGPDFAVTAKINGTDLNPEGMTIERVALAGPILEAAGADMIAVSGGGSLTDVLGMSADGHQPEGWKVPFAEAVKKSGVRIPVEATGSIRHPQYIEEILSEGRCDMIGMGRGLLAEPEWVNKLAEGREDEMHNCISCMACFSPVVPGCSNCSVNPLATRELENIEVRKDGGGRTAAVVGGGPGGMQAAVTLAERGFKPVLFEKDGKLGGLENLAAAPVGKAKIQWHIDYLAKQLRRLGVEVRLGSEATAGDIRALKPYGVVIASGSIATYPRSIPGIGKPHVAESRQVLPCFPSVKGENVVVVGAGLVGLETGLTFADMGNRVTLMDILPSANPMEMPIDMMMTLGHVLKAGVELRMEHKLLEITDTAVLAENRKTGEKVTLPADRVVLCMGSRANDALYEELKGEFDRIFNVGDSREPDKILTAVQGGFDAAIAM